MTIMGCSQKPGRMVNITNQRKIVMSPEVYGRIDIKEEDLNLGMAELFVNLSKELGPIHYDPIIKDYAPMIQQALYNSGYCSIQKLNINGTTVDIDVYFKTDQPQPMLTIEAYLNGASQPIHVVTNQFYMTAG